MVRFPSIGTLQSHLHVLKQEVLSGKMWWCSIILPYLGMSETMQCVFEHWRGAPELSGFRAFRILNGQIKDTQLSMYANIQNIWEPWKTQTVLSPWFSDRMYWVLVAVDTRRWRTCQLAVVNVPNSIWGTGNSVWYKVPHDPIAAEI